MKKQGLVSLALCAAVLACPLAFAQDDVQQAMDEARGSIETAITRALSPSSPSSSTRHPIGPTLSTCSATPT